MYHVSLFLTIANKYTIDIIKLYIMSEQHNSDINIAIVQGVLINS